MMVWAMVIVGGITRLTGSGLSMVEWRPLMGAIPPIGEAQWLDVFEQYKSSPQYAQVNHWMELEHFKQIFFWEYLHRLLGRSAGIVAFVPWVYFLIRKRMTPRTAFRAFLAILFGGSQGLLGWFMVKSGLVDIPEVSHFRLAAHLGLAFFVGQWILWLLLDIRSQPRTEAQARPALARWLAGFIALLSVQVIYGAFMAGTRAGWMFATFPDMNGAYLPGPFFNGASLVGDLLNNPWAIHWVHRFLAYLVTVAAIGLAIALRRGPRSNEDARRASALLVVSILVQFVLGVLTVVLSVPIWAAVAHQACAFLLLACSVFALHCARSPHLPPAQP
jgi:cytochrome c oxidase assembly protein subunit 15